MGAAHEAGLVRARRAVQQRLHVFSLKCVYLSLALSAPWAIRSSTQPIHGWLRRGPMQPPPYFAPDQRDIRSIAELLEMKASF